MWRLAESLFFGTLATAVAVVGALLIVKLWTLAGWWLVIGGLWVALTMWAWEH